MFMPTAGISWETPCADLKWTVLTSFGLLQPTNTRMVTGKWFALAVHVRARLFFALSPSLPSLGNGESWC